MTKKLLYLNSKGILMIPENFIIGAVGSLIFALVGIILLLGGFKIFDFMLPKVDFQKSLNENPMATAVVIGAFFYALSTIIAAVLH